MGKDNERTFGGEEKGYAEYAGANSGMEAGESDFDLEIIGQNTNEFAERTWSWMEEVAKIKDC